MNSSTVDRRTGYVTGFGNNAVHGITVRVV